MIGDKGVYLFQQVEKKIIIILDGRQLKNGFNIIESATDMRVESSLSTQS